MKYTQRSTKFWIVEKKISKKKSRNWEIKDLQKKMGFFVALTRTETCIAQAEKRVH